MTMNTLGYKDIVVRVGMISLDSLKNDRQPSSAENPLKTKILSINGLSLNPDK
jgi:hypothetical protein